MNISFIQSTSKEGYYDLIVEGQTIMVEINSKEAVECLRDLQGQREVIEQFSLFQRAFSKCNLNLPDPSVGLGQTVMLFSEGTSPIYPLTIEVYDRVSEDGSSYIMFLMKWKVEPEINMWGFYISRNTKEVGKLIGSNISGPEGELRQQILGTLILKLGRDLRIQI